VRERLQSRLDGLRKEYEAGREELERLKTRQAYLRETMLRIGGAIQILEELLAEPSTGSARELVPDTTARQNLG
jgi:predicted nuclease with TOPRIM domain